MPKLGEAAGRPAERRRSLFAYARGLGPGPVRDAVSDALGRALREAWERDPEGYARALRALTARDNGQLFGFEEALALRLGLAGRVRDLYFEAWEAEAGEAPDWEPRGQSGFALRY